MRQVAVLLILTSRLVAGLENGLARTPPMGWLAWERFRCNTDCEGDPENCIGERLFRRMADMMVVEGYQRAGYLYVMLDDCWSSLNRTKEGRLEVDPDRFPSGIKGLADYVHALGLKLGIYQDYGTETCGGYPGSLGHLSNDAQTFAEWEVDYVKMDGCNSDPKDMDEGFSQFGAALKATGRNMVYQCEWPLYQGGHGIKPNYTAIREHCNLWRNFYDVQDNWNNIQGIIDYYGEDKDDFLRFAGPGGWNDPDMLVVGNFGLSYDQAKAQMALWAMFAAPLIMSVDLRTIRPEFKDILQHSGIIKISQDPLGISGRRVAREEHIDFFLRPVLPSLGNQTSYVVALLNRWGDGGVPLWVSFSLRDLGVKTVHGFVGTDVFDGTELGYFHSYSAARVAVNPLGIRLIKFSVVKNPGSLQVGPPSRGVLVENPGLSGWKGRTTQPRRNYEP